MLETNIKRLKRLFFLIGIGLFCYLLVQVKPEVIWRYLKEVEFRFIFLILVSFGWHLCNSFAWEFFLKELNQRVRLKEILKIKISGEAVNSITPFSWGGGDPARIYLLKSHIPLTQGTASVAVDRTLSSLAVVIFMLIGILLAFFKYSLPFSLKFGFPLLLAVIFFSTYYIYRRSQHGLFQTFLDWLQWLKIKKSFSLKTQTKVHEIDAQISQFYRSNHQGFWLALLFHFLGRCLGVLEIFLAAKFLGHSISFLEAYLLGSITVLINLVFSFVPGAFGIMEGAYTGIFALFGKDPAIGTSIQILRRARMVFWTSLGFFFMARLKKQA